MKTPALYRQIVFLFLGLMSIGLVSRAYAKHDDAWRYAALPGVEILTSASDRDIEKILHNFLLFRRAVNELGLINQIASDNLLTLVFCKRESQYAKFNPKNADSFQLRGRHTIVINLSFFEIVHGGGGWWNPATGQGQGVSPPSPLDDPKPSAAELAAVAPSLFLQRFYTSVVLHRIGEHPPPWLSMGLGKFLRGMSYSEEWIGFSQLETDKSLAARKAGSEKDMETALQGKIFLTFEQLFAPKEIPSDVVRSIGTIYINTSQRFTKLEMEPSGTWVDECFEFTHMCLLGADGKYRPGFIKFAQMAANGPVDEAAFREAFGKSYNEMLLELWCYTKVSEPTGFKIQGPDGGAPAPLPEIQFRAAAVEEVSHIKTVVAADEMKSAGNLNRR